MKGDEKMIKEVKSEDFNVIKHIIEKTDIARNYFILLGLSGNKAVYDKVFGEYEDGELKAALFIRKSGLLQFFTLDEFDLDGFIEIINSMKNNRMIGPKLYCDKFFNSGTFSIVLEGAYIAKLDKSCKLDYNGELNIIRSINSEDLDEIVDLYKNVFDSFSPKNVMEQKLLTNRGRGVCIEINKKIISIAQSDFETDGSALIVGVATEKKYRKQGLATLCTKYLSCLLQNEGKDVYLQYDNLQAGKIYERLGYKVIDRVIHYSK